MASSAQTLTTNIVINAKTGSGFSQVGATLTELGSLVNGMSQQLITFGKESIDTYREYEKSMREAEVALSTQYGRGTKELAGYMSQIDTAATEWAATTIFHTDDVANAIAEAAHAGWDFDQIMSGIPAAMELAQAGSLDLSDAVNYIVKSTSAMGVEFDDVGRFIDLWAYAANSSASTIGEFGDAMLRMGSTMRFAADPEELMTLMAVTANAGQVGSEAGTLIRNSMMRLVAPTKKAREVMGELGATSEEMASTLNDEDLINANKRLEQYGFSVFDQNGELKNVLDIYRELYMAMGGIAGTFENLDRNEDVSAILGAIFPTRTITEALTLLRAAADGYDDLYGNMKNGAAEGYGAYAAETMMDTLDGRIETFNSKLERLKQLVGESLSGQVSDVLGEIGGFIDNIAGLDDGVFDGLVNALEVFAASGPALLTAGGAARLLGILFSNPAMAAGAIGMATIALGRFLTTVRDAEIEDSFGELMLGDEALEGVRKLTGQFENAYRTVDKFEQKISESFNSYKTASSSLSGSLLENFLSGARLTADDKTALYGLADEMYTSLVDGITAKRNASKSYWSLLFGSDTDSDSYKELMGITDDAYNEAIAEAEGLSKKLQEALTAAFNDGHVDETELQEIEQYMNEYNDAVARAAADAADREARIQMQMLLDKGQSASLDSLNEISSEMVETRDAAMAELDERSARMVAEARIDGASDTAIAEIEARQLQERMQRRAGYDEQINTLWETGISQSDYGDAYAQLQRLADSVRLGNMSMETASGLFRNQFGFSDRYALNELLSGQVADHGTTHEIGEAIQDYITTGNRGMADEMMNLLSMREIAAGSERYAASSFDGASPMERGGTTEQSVTLAPNMAGVDSILSNYQATVNIEPKVDTGALTSELASTTPVVSVEPRVDESIDPRTALAEQGVEVDVTGNTESLRATIATADLPNVLTYVNGDVEQLRADIFDENGHTITTNVDGNPAGLAAAINAYQGKTVTVYLRGVKLFDGFATGGRATTASIFGEAGPEWAIPEEHSERTASLLNAAREASGFTWPDLLSRFGGLNAGNSSGNSQTLVYSPTINAGNAEGVEEVLRNDKDRLEGWYRDMRMRESAEVYA